MGSVKGKPRVLNTRELTLYGQAYRLALASLRGYGWTTNATPGTDEVRTALAESIMEKIVSGETDPNKIRKLALDNVFLGERLGKH